MYSAAVTVSVSDSENADFRCWPSYEKIAEEVGCSKRTVPKHVRELCEKRLITVEPTSVMTKDGLKWNGNLLYKVLPIQGAVEYYYEQQLTRLDAALERKRVKMKQQRQRSQAKYLAAKTAAREPEELPL